MEWTGQLVRVLRRRVLRMSQETFAHYLGVSVRTIQNWEAGVSAPSPTHQAALDTALDRLTPRQREAFDRYAYLDDVAWGQQTGLLAPHSSGQEFPANRREALKALGGAAVVASSGKVASALSRAPHPSVTALRQALLVAATTEPEPTLLDIDLLAQRVQRAWELRQGADYESLGELLPPLLTALQTAVVTLEDDARPVAWQLLAHAYNAASSALKKLGEPELALIAADRGVQAGKTLDDPLLVAAGGYRLANVFLPAGQFAAASDVASSATGVLEPLLNRSPAHVATWGGLVLTAAVASSSRGDEATAWELLGEAKAAARQLGREHADLHAVFGPTSVAIYAVQIAVRLENGSEALRRAEHVHVDRLPVGLLERRSHFLINTARAHHQAGSSDEAVVTLLRAERLAAQEIRLDAEVRGLVLDLLGRERKGAAPGLRELATRIGVAA
jgi:transcriptional regulator with XRE-family HTH domain